MSNGMAEIFVNRFRRDYFSRMDLSDARTVMVNSCGFLALQHFSSALSPENEIALGIQAVPGKAVSKSTGAISVNLRAVSGDTGA